MMIVEELKSYIADHQTTISEALKKMDSNKGKMLFITDDKSQLCGSLTDGDVRRWIIKTGNLAASVLHVMNPNPKYLFEYEVAKALDVLQEYGIKNLPILNAEKHIIDIVFATDMGEGREVCERSLLEIPVIIMAGGKGTRLYPYTKILPKPLIPIGEIPIVERIIKRFCEYGAEKYYMTVNYKKEMIKSYFAEVSPAYELTYVEEAMPLGTAGSIKLITEKFETPVIVTNCDILVDANYDEILKYHRQSGNALTVVSVLKNIVVPYGVLNTCEGGIVTSVEEKPKLSYFINSGMYIIEPDVIEKIPDNTFFHMTDMMALLLKEGYRVGMYPISEDSFLDMGEFDEMRRMEERLNIKKEL